MISESNFHFLNKNAQEKNIPAHFPDSCNRYASITGSPKTKAGYPVFAQILGFFPLGGHTLPPEQIQPKVYVTNQLKKKTFLGHNFGWFGQKTKYL